MRISNSARPAARRWLATILLASRCALCPSLSHLQGCMPVLCTPWRTSNFVLFNDPHLIQFPPLRSSNHILPKESLLLLIEQPQGMPEPTFQIQSAHFRPLRRAHYL